MTLACNSTTTDQIGSTRPINVGTACTSGAVEVAMPPLCPTPLEISDTTELAECITWANANRGADTLGLDADITLSTALPQVTSEITLEGAGFSVDGASTYRVFEVTSTGNFTVNQITMQNGSTSGNGGAILNDGGTLTVTNSTVSGNTGDNGGGIYSASGTLTATNSTISGNTGNVGGGIYIANGTATVTNSTISGNTSGFPGGGIYNVNGTLTVTNSTISGDNYASSGDGSGGIYNAGTATVTNSTISGNNATTVAGGDLQRQRYGTGDPQYLLR